MIFADIHQNFIRFFQRSARPASLVGAPIEINLEGTQKGHWFPFGDSSDPDPEDSS